ncbi:MAG: tetrahydrofolate synthase, partial [Prevotella salivae]|nr:tetrahydrofolate synthase [Segatella salivae]
MNVFAIANVVTMQRRGIYANIPMNTFITTNVLISQLGTSCSFDSPG